jgi:hypothetical protein
MLVDRARPRLPNLQDVGAAETAASKTQQDFSGPADGARPLFDGQVLAAEDRGSHAAISGHDATDPRCAAIQQRSAIATLRPAGTVTRSPSTRNRPASMRRSSAQ